jgi:GNAT superfamily N-acetyltransferase
MQVQIVEEKMDALLRYASVPIAFRVESRYRLEPIDGGPGGIRLVEESVAPYDKDYDSIPGEAPSDWATRWNVSTWGFFGAWSGRLRVGGAAVATGTAAVETCHGREDVAVLWDLRVQREYRRQGVGKSLFGAAADWARDRQYRALIVETQNVNVPACRFYARQGCELAAIDSTAYPPEMEEVRLLWILGL